MLIFPPSIVNEDQDRPIVVFRNTVNDTQPATHIAFPIPQSLQFGDSASYNNSELGFSGSLIVAGGRSQDLSGAFTNVVNSALNSVPKDMRSLAGLMGSRFTGGSTQSAISVASGTTLNKNIVTEFTGVGTRSFSFQFKLITGTQAESNLVKNIVEIFRTSMYPEGNNLQLKFPATWYINFKKGGEEITYIPKIFETYLTAVSTAYNSSMNMFHPDGSPVEIDLQLSFMESRALTKQDIQKLNVAPFQEGDFTRTFQINETLKENVLDNTLRQRESNNIA